MPHPHRLPRNSLGVLIEAAKARAGLEWWEVELALGIHKGSREAWVNGKVTKPPLIGVCRLAHHLKITGDELMACVVENELPLWIPVEYVERELAREAGKARPPKGPGRGPSEPEGSS